jgi:hypothetical protein
MFIVAQLALRFGDLAVCVSSSSHLQLAPSAMIKRAANCEFRAISMKLEKAAKQLEALGNLVSPTLPDRRRPASSVRDRFVAIRNLWARAGQGVAIRGQIGETVMGKRD